MTPDTFNRRSPLHRVGLYLLFLSILGIASGALVYTSVMQYLGWSVKTGGVTFSLAMSDKPTLWLYRSVNTERFFASMGGSYDVLLKPWLDYGIQTGHRVKEVTSLKDVSPRADHVLVLPSAVALDAAERATILRFRESGGNVLSSWATGSRSEKGEWLGWTFMQQLAGISVSGEASHADPAMLTVGEGPGTQRFAAGSRILLTPVAEKPLLLEGGHVALLPDVGNKPTVGEAPVSSHAPKIGMVAVNELSTPQPSRVAVLGMAETSWARHTGQVHAVLDQLFGWLNRVPVVARSEWPDGQRSAIVVALEVPAGRFDASRLGPWVQRVAPAGSAYLPAATDSAAVQALRAAAPNWDVGLVVQDAAQLSLVLPAVAPTGSSRRGVDGVLVPSAELGKAFDQAFFDAGGRYRLGGGQFTGALPDLAPVNGQKPGKRLVTLPMTSATSDDQQWPAMALGGMTALHWRLPETGWEADGIPGWTQSLRQPPGSVWVTHAAQVTDWWLDRERFQMASRHLGARTEIDVSVLGDQPFDRGALVVILPFKSRMPTLQGLKANMPVPVVSMLDEYRALIRFGKLEPGNYSYQMTY